MRFPDPNLRALLAAVIVAPALCAQTWTGATSVIWTDPTNWTLSTVPAGSDATAVFTSAGLNPLGESTTTIQLTGSQSLGSIQFQAGTPWLVLSIDNSGGAADLTLTGAGLVDDSATPKFINVGVFHDPSNPPATLTFTNHASAGDVTIYSTWYTQVAFRGQSTAGKAYLAASTVDFYDQSTAGNATFPYWYGTTVGFHDQSTAGSATLDSNIGAITFSDSSTAGNATLVRSNYYDGSSAQVAFKDSSNSGTANISVFSLNFSGWSSAAQATIGNTGLQLYSSHGEYVTYYANLTFHDQATASSASIINNSLGTVVFTDQSTAGQASIYNNGTIIFSGHSSLAAARLTADSGSYLQNQGYNQAATPFTTGGVYFTEQATGGNGRIEIASAQAWLDFSGLTNGTGLTGRTPLAATPTGPAVVPDDRVAFALGSITNTAPGGTIRLGGTSLVIGFDGSDMTLSALVTDVGGRYGSTAGEALQGGSLTKVGTGTLTITNPANRYSGPTAVSGGALNLSGGSVSNVVLSDTGRLTGTGTVRGPLLNGAVVSPGNSAGTITVLGDYTQSASGSLNLEIVSATDRDRLIVSGSASLNGHLGLTLLNGYVPVGNAVLPLISAGTINGQFSTISLPAGLGAALADEIVYSPAGVSLQVTQKPFAGFSNSPASAALGAQLDATLTGATGDYRQLLTALNTLPTSAQITAALAALAPDRYTAIAQNALLSAGAQQAARDRRFAQWRDDTGRGFAVFFEAGQRKVKFGGGSGLPEATAKTEGGTAGGVWRNDAFTLEAALTQERGSLALDPSGSRADLGSVAPMFTFQYSPGPLFFNASVSWSSDDYRLRRSSSFPGYAQSAVARPAGTRCDGSVNFGYALRAGAWTITPAAGLLSAQFRVADFRESGAAGANLDLSGWSAQSVQTRAGFEAAYTGAKFTPRLAIAWLHAVRSTDSFYAKLAGTAAEPYRVSGRATDKDFVQASLAFEIRVGKAATLYASLAGASGPDSRISSDLTAGFTRAF